MPDKGAKHMRIGCVKEIKKHEYRVGLTPDCVKAYVAAGHAVSIEKGSGLDAGFEDAEYAAAGAKVVGSRKEIFDASDMIVKVKEPQPEECALFHEGQTLFTYLHLAADEELTRELVKRKVKGVAYETIETPDGQLPLLRPMSQIAGRMSIQEGARFLERPQGGRGVLLGGVPGVDKGRVLVLGGGVVGTNAARMALGIGAEVTIMDVNLARLEAIDDSFGGRLTTLFSSRGYIERALEEADLVIGAVLVHGAKAPHLVTQADLKRMKKGSVMVDVAVDQGGCFQTTHPTTHDDPVFTVDGVVHYCVANMPGGVSRTSTMALTAATRPIGLTLAAKGVEEAARASPMIAKGVNVYGGAITYPAVAEAFGKKATPLAELI
jgi:alanine dehydrogenase